MSKKLAWQAWKTHHCWRNIGDVNLNTKMLENVLILHIISMKQEPIKWLVQEVLSHLLTVQPINNWGSVHCVLGHYAHLVLQSHVKGRGLCQSTSWQTLKHNMFRMHFIFMFVLIVSTVDWNVSCVELLSPFHWPPLVVFSVLWRCSQGKSHNFMLQSPEIELLC